jgi:adenylate kinase
MRLVILGAPGSGKGTQTSRVKEQAGVPAISTGDILRANLAAGTELGKKAKAYMEAGELVPDDLIISIAMQRIEEDDCRNGFLLDGFPRTIEQAEALDAHLAEIGIKIDRAINMDVPDEVLIQRLTGRRVCRDCGVSFHVTGMPPKKPGVCDACGGELYQRSDDNEETVRNRIEVYYRQSKSLIDYYKAKGLYSSVDATKPLDVVSKEILEIASHT